MTLSKNTIFNLFGSCLPLGIAVLVAPLILDSLGFSVMSKLALLWGLWGAFNLLDLGFTRAITYRVAKSHDLTSQKKIITSGLIATTVFSLLLTLGLVLVVTFLTSIYSEHLASHGWTSIAAIATSLSLLPTLLLTGIRGVLEGLNKFKASNANRLALGVTVYGLPAVLLLPSQPSIEIYILLNLTLRVLIVIGNIWVLRKFLVQLKLTAITDEYYKLFRAGIWVFFSGLIIPVLMYGDRLIINATLGEETLAYYGLMQEGIVKLLIFPGAFASALFYANTHGGKNGDDLLRSTNKITKLIIFPACLCVLLGLGLMPEFIAVWLDEKAALAMATPSQIMLIGILASSLALPPLMALFAMGEFKLTFRIYLLEFILFVAFHTVFFDNMSIITFSILWTSRCVLDLALIYSSLVVIARKKLLHQKSNVKP